jgi:hypothetical protein
VYGRDSRDLGYYMYMRIWTNMELGSIRVAVHVKLNVQDTVLMSVVLRNARFSSQGVMLAAPSSRWIIDRDAGISKCLVLRYD